MFEAGKGRIRSPQQLFDPVPVHDLGAMDLCLEDETLSVHEQVALAALDLLTSVVAALFSPPTPVVLTDWLPTLCLHWVEDFCSSEPADVLG